MAQASYIPVETDTDSAALVFFEDILEAIATLNSGATEPTEKFTSMLWMDTAAGYIKQYNGSSWDRLILPPLDQNDFADNSATEAPSQQSARAFIGGEASVEVDLTGQTTASITALSAGINKIRVVFSDANLSGTDDMLVQLSSGASFVTAGYESSSVALSASTPATSRSTAGFILRRSNASTSAAGFFELTRVPGTHQWFVEAKAHIDGVAAVLVSSGYIDLGSELDGVQLLTTGANTFDSGAVQFILR